MDAGSSIRLIVLSALALFTTGCELTQDGFAEEYAQKYCSLVFECNNQDEMERLGQTEEECRDNLEAAVSKTSDGGGNCSFSSSEAEDLLDALDDGTCEGLESAAQPYNSSKAFPCDLLD